MGKMTNILSNDFNLTEIKIFFFFRMFTSPIIYPVTLFVSYIFFEKEVWIFILVIAILFPLKFYITRAMASTLRKANEEKDRRVRSISDLIDSLRPIKTYGWESYFSEQIKDIRMREVALLKRHSLKKGFIITLCYTLPYLALFCVFFYKWNSGILSEKIISPSLQLVGFFTTYDYFFTKGLIVLYELKVIFQRFIGIQ